MAQVKELLALNIKVLRKKCDFSQEKLAEAANLSAQSISDIEGCRTWVSDKALERLAKALNVDIFQLFMPPDEDNGNNSEVFLYNQLMKLRITMKEDIDKRLDQFYLSKKSFF
ncbi:MAG: helix-turn-helix domain-containing protein [Treponema sp.]|jgi:transcriptional regulator with XRE-family HTH domain|nr:helix-turn-helix domain-containing protein [Treponema sp.]